MSGISYILRWSNKNTFSITTSEYLFSMVSGDRYLARGSKGNILCVTITGTVTVSRWVVQVVTTPLLDFLIIHWIHWIQWNSFEEIPSDIYSKCIFDVQDVVTLLVLPLFLQLLCITDSEDLRYISKIVLTNDD